MYAKAACISVQTLAYIFSIRPPPSSVNKERSDKTKKEGFLLRTIIESAPKVATTFGLSLAGLYIYLMSRGVISGKLKNWQVAATVSGVLGYLLRIWSFKTLDRFFTYSLTIRQGHRLVQTGPYRLLIHPSYTAVIISGTPYLITLSIDGFWTYVIKPYVPIPVPDSFVVASIVIASLIPMIIRVRSEEKMLEQHFGSEWKEHVSQRWRFIPYVI
ncbi:hypothetical protein BGZ49_000254 [Haplosporangium sp. Z 27]|nr:hypothetical protein BGZ49_000254 [Haplosporangium sp. Z 27]